MRTSVRSWTVKGLRLPVAGFLAALSLVGCSITDPPATPREPITVVHLILTADRSSHIVLVERTLTGREVPYSGGGLLSDGDPVIGARVTVTGESGEVALAVPVSESDSGGPGQYRLPLNVRQGAEYRLRVETPDGDVVTGRTRVPRAGRNENVQGLVLNIDRDTLRLPLPPAAFAPRYLLRAGSYVTLVDDGIVMLPGSLRIPTENGFPRLFRPGTSQTIILSALDTNYHDYLRSGNDPFTGRGLITRLEGGLGVFGSVTLLQSYGVAVIADEDKDFEGTWIRDGEVQGSLPSELRLYEDYPIRGGSQITGTYFFSQADAGFADGEIRNGSITLDLENRRCSRPFCSARFDPLQGTLVLGVLTLTQSDGFYTATYHRQGS